MEKVNCPAEVNRKQQDHARRAWQTPVVEELLVNETEVVISGKGPDGGIYSDS